MKILVNFNFAAHEIWTSGHDIPAVGRVKPPARCRDVRAPRLPRYYLLPKLRHHLANSLILVTRAVNATPETSVAILQLLAFEARLASRAYLRCGIIIDDDQIFLAV